MVFLIRDNLDARLELGMHPKKQDKKHSKKHSKCSESCLLSRVLVTAFLARTLQDTFLFRLAV